MAKTDTEIVALTYRAIENSDFDGEDQRQAIETSDSFYFGRSPGGTVAGRSQSVSMDVQNVITATTGSIMESLDTQGFMRFAPIDDNDETSAQLESAAVQAAIQRAGGYLVKLGAIENSLRYVNAAIRVWIDNAPEQVTQRLVNASEADAKLVQAQFPDEFEADIEQLKEGFKITIQKPASKLMLENIDLARLMYRKDHPSIDTSTMDFLGINHTDTRQDLIAMGFDKAIVNDLPEGQENYFTEGAVRSKLMAESVSYTTAPDRSMDRISWSEVWIKVDGELERVAVSERKLLDRTLASHIPVAIGSGHPQPHRVQGISLASKLEPIQTSGTEARRQLEDNLSANLVPKVAAYAVNLDDATDGRTSGIVRMEGPASRYEPVPVQDLTPGSLQYLDYLRGVRSESGGAALDAESPENEALKMQVGAIASQQVLMNQELRSVFAAKNIANTLWAPTLINVHRALREDFNGTLTVRVNDKFQQVDPSTWQPRELLTSPAGLSPTQRNREAANIQQTIQTQMALLQAGSTLVDQNTLHNALLAWGYAVNLPIDEFYVDPESESGQQAQQQQAQQQQQQQQMAAQIEQIPAMIEQMKEEASTARNTQDNEVKLKIAGIQAELDEAKLVLEGIESAQDRETAQLTNGSLSDGR